MKLIISQSSLWSLIQNVTGIVERRHKKPILNNVLIDAQNNVLRLVATDEEAEVIQQQPLKIKEPGRLTVPAKKFADICRTLHEGSDIELAETGQKLTVRCERGRYTLPILPADIFPQFSDVKLKLSFTINSDRLGRLLRGTAFAMAVQDVRHYLNGLLLEITADGVLRAVATDGHRLALGEVPVTLAGTDIADRMQVLVPRKAVLEVIRTLDSSNEAEVILGFGENFLQVSQTGRVFTAKLIDGRFPDIERVIPRGNDKRLVADREAMKAAITRTSVVCNERFRGVRLTLERDLLRFYAYNSDREEAEEEMPVSYEGAPVEIAFNAAYLVDALGSIQGSEVIMKLSGPSTSCLLFGKDDEDFEYVVMPIRL